MTLSALGIFSAAGAGGAVGDYELIQTQILTTTESSVVFSNLGNFSTTYRHLQIRGVGRTTLNDTDDVLYVRINGNTGSNYSSHELFAAGSGRAVAAQVSQTFMNMGRLTAANTNSNVFGPNVVDILDAYSTTKNKTLRGFSGADRSPNPFVNFNSGAFYNTASITSITLFGGGSLVAGTRFSIYGIRG